MSELVQIYKDNIKTIFNRVGKLLENLVNLPCDKAEKTIQDVENSIKEAERIVKNLEIDLMTSNNSNHNIIMKNYKNALDQYKKRIKSTREKNTTNENLNSILISEKVNNQKEKLINNEEMAWSQYEKLEKAKRTSYEMESISIETAKELNGHTEKIKRVKDKLSDINGEIYASNSIIGRMLKLEYRNKIVLLMFSAAFILIFLAIIYFKFFGAGSEPEMPITNDSNSDGIDVSQRRFLNNFI
jgi:predicted RND superfamily exporter protein